MRRVISCQQDPFFSPCGAVRASGADGVKRSGRASHAGCCGGADVVRTSSRVRKCWNGVGVSAVLRSLLRFACVKRFRPLPSFGVTFVVRFVREFTRREARRFWLKLAGLTLLTSEAASASLRARGPEAAVAAPLLRGLRGLCGLRGLRVLRGSTGRTGLLGDGGGSSAVASASASARPDLLAGRSLLSMLMLGDCVSRPLSAKSPAGSSAAASASVGPDLAGWCGILSMSSA